MEEEYEKDRVKVVYGKRRVKVVYGRRRVKVGYGKLRVSTGRYGKENKKRWIWKYVETSEFGYGKERPLRLDM